MKRSATYKPSKSYTNNYKDDRTMEKIEKNLKLIGEDLNIKRIHHKKSDYLKLINKEAKKIYSGMKEQVNYP
jgi:hypothetical protein